MSEAWGDAPPLITCPSACTDSEKSFVLRRLHSSPIRKGHESRKNQRGLTRSPSVSPFSLAKQSPTSHLSRCVSRIFMHESAYFTSSPPSAPLILVARGYQSVDTLHVSTSTTGIEKTSSYYAGIRSLVEEVADAAANKKRNAKPEEMTSETSSVNIACSSPQSYLSPVKRRRFRRHSVAVTRNVAVQAITMKIERDGLQAKTDPETQLEWVGGVRALRDSHVRHVLRQLKHIDRLNRALDRVHHSETD